MKKALQRRIEILCGFVSLKFGEEEYRIEQWEVLPTHDEKTCPICKEKAGKKYSIDEAPVPLHPRCRCAMIPVVEF